DGFQDRCLKPLGHLSAYEVPLAIRQSDGKGRCGLTVGSTRDRMWVGRDQSISLYGYNVPIWGLQLKWGSCAH
ncbi:MAG: hypothetical protein NWQ92_01350, partial [Sphingorhabdus sp.]|uniref:hypothetical protein n=1 Tax=Sphingorhabdus sp. TaxID=1902408 RepID=UPI00273DF8E0